MKLKEALLSTGIGLLSIAAPIYWSLDLYSRGPSPEKSMEVTKREAVDPLYDLSGLKEKATLELRFGKDEVNNVVIIQASVRNTGKPPILPEDFHEPLKVSINSPFRILAVENSNAVYPTEVKLQWTRETPTRFVAAPTLFNPGDTAALIVYATNTEFGRPKDGVQPTAKLEIDTRIVNMKGLTEAPDLLDQLMTGNWGLIVWLSGWSLIFTVGAALVFQGAYMTLLYGARMIERLTTRAIAALTVTMLISLCAAESSASLLFRTPRFGFGAIQIGGGVPYGLLNGIPIVINAALLGYLAFRAARARDA